MAFVAVAIGGAAAVSLGTGIAGAMAQSDAANKASEIQAQQYAETKAALNQGKTEALGYIDPYAKAGGQALNELAYGMGLQTPTAGYTSQNTQQGGLANYGQDQYSKDPAYTPMVNSLAQLQATPGYQFQLEQGLQGVNNSAAAKGGLLSGANIKAINNYAQGQASTGYQAAWDRAQSAYQNAFGRNQQKFSNLQSMANNGQNAAGLQGNAALSVGEGLAGASTNYGNNQSNLAMAQGQISANMLNGIGNTVNTGISQALSAYQGGSPSFGGGNTGNSGAPSSRVSWNYNPALTPLG